jgi:hypothetical protein
MKTARLIILPVVLVVSGTYWLAIPEPSAPPPKARIKVENDRTQISAAPPVCSYDYYFIPQNRTPEISVPLH